jgi:hypothetical protein
MFLSCLLTREQPQWLWKGARDVFASIEDVCLFAWALSQIQELFEFLSGDAQCNVGFEVI